MPFHTTNNIAVRFSASFENRFVVCFYYNIECFSCLGAGGGTADLAGRDYREQGKNYPEPKFAGATPAYGLFIRHADGVYADNLFFTTSKPDHRPAVMLVDVKNHSITNLHTQTQKGVKTIVEK